METNRVIITLHKGTDVLGFVAEMSQLGHTSPYVPDRAVEIANPKDDSLYNVDFTLTRDEFLQIQQDPRVRAARWGSKADNGLVLRPWAQDTAQPLYRINSWNSNQDGNWGRAAVAATQDPFPNTGSQSTHFISNYQRNYTLDGTDVDVVIMDTGIEASHPEWQDSQGQSRLHLIDWNLYVYTTGATNSANLLQATFTHLSSPTGAGIPVGTFVAIDGTPVPEDYQSYRVRVVASTTTTTTVEYDSPRSGNIVLAGGEFIYWFPESGSVTGYPNFYTDVVGHGTNVASIAVGRRYGWATGAGIYAMNVNGTNGGNMPVGALFNRLRIWHQNKPLDAQGRRRPTVANCSFGYVFTLINAIDGYNYRDGGNVSLAYNSTNATAWRNVGVLGPSFNGNDLIPGRVISIDSDIEDAIAAGVIIVAAAGNDSYKIDVPGGLDYDNVFTLGVSGTAFYHRGGTPDSVPGVITVGAIDYINNTNEVKAGYSRAGPGIDVWAPGSSVAGACSNVYNVGGYPVSTYPLDTSYRTVKPSGTSMASPQTAGVVATLLQARPWLTADDVLAELAGNFSSPGRLADVGSNSYTSTQNLQGAANRYLRMPFVAATVSEFMPGGESDVQGRF